MSEEKKILDSGARREFSSGAVRDMADDKGRMDLVPLDILANQIKFSLLTNCHKNEYASIIRNINNFLFSGIDRYIYNSIEIFSNIQYNGDLINAILEVSKHYSGGSLKYSERNWEKGIVTHSFVDSGLRHLIKCIRGDNDEPHDRAFIWNMMGLLWTKNNKPFYDDLPYFRSKFQHKFFVEELPDINNINKVVISDIFILSEDFIYQCIINEDGNREYKQISKDALLEMQSSVLEEMLHWVADADEEE